MATTIYNGLEYSTKSINRSFRIKVNGIVDGKKINKLVGVKGLIELIGVGMANKMLRRAFNGKDDLREAYGTMNPDIIPAPTGTRKPADTVKTYFDTEKQEYRCFKKANLIRIA